MKKAPNSKSNLERAISHYAGSDSVRANELGDADAFELIPMPDEIASLAEYLCFPPLGKVRVMKLEYQVAQKLHGASERGSKRAHDLIDLQLIASQNAIDLVQTASICRKLFRYRQKQPWPTPIVKNENWDAVYADQKGTLPVLATVDEAIVWTNNLIRQIDAEIEHGETQTATEVEAMQENRSL